MIRQQVTVLAVMLVLSTIILLSKAANHTGEPKSPTFSNQHPNVYVFETDENGNQQNLTLPCPIAAPSSTLNYSWFKENQELPRSMMNEEGSLIVPNITEGEYASREGVDYYCVASDNIGFNVAVRSRNITVYYAYFSGFEQMAESGESTIEVVIPVALNSDVALKCDVLDAKPPPQIKWNNDQGEIQEDTEGNRIRFLDGGCYLYLRNLQATQLEQQYYCNVVNANLSLEISAPTRYVLIDNTTQGELIEYKQIGNLRAFVENTSFEFSYVSGVFGDNTNETINRFSVNDIGVSVLGSIGMIREGILTMPGMVHLKATVSYNGMTEMRSGTLTIYQVPRITNTFHDERDHLAGEESLTYTCQFEGFPLPNITFFFNGAVISPDSGVIIVNNSLTIPSSQVSHSGIYQCIVSNEFGDDQQAWLLEIRQPISPIVQTLNFTELGALDDRDFGALIVRNNGSIVSFSVDVVADPCPDVVWIFNNTVLGPTNNTFMYNNPCIAVDGRNSIWTYALNVTLTLETTGQYLANFINFAGAAFLPMAYFTVPVPIFVVGLSLNDTCLKEGSSVSIRCNISGFPHPRVEFRKDNVDITPEAGMFENILLEFYDQIVIRNVTMKDEGSYSCIASSKMGTQSLDRQNFDFCSLPNIISVHATPNLLIGESLFIECTIDGIPPPTTIWIKDGTPLEEMQNDDNRIRIIAIPARMSSRVEITSARIDDSGEYLCIVSNIAGSVMHSFTIDPIQAYTQQTGGGTDVVVSAPLSLGLTVGATVGVTVLISAALLIVLVLVCVQRRLRSRTYKRSDTKPQMASTYSANVAYTGTMEFLREPLEAVYPLYDTIPYSDPAEVQTNEKAQIYKRAHIYEKIYEDVELTKEPPKDTTVERIPGNVAKNVDIPEEEIQVSESNDKDSHDEGDGKWGQRSQEIESLGEQETTLNSDPMKLTKSKHQYSEAKVGVMNDDTKGEIKSNDDVHKSVRMGGSGQEDAQTSQIYASISAEHKAKKRRDRLKKESGQPKESIPSYGTAPNFSEPAQVQSKDEPLHEVVQTYEMSQTYERVQTYEKIHHNDAKLSIPCEKFGAIESEETSDFEPTDSEAKDEPNHKVLQTNEKSQIYETAQTYERINRNDILLVEQLLSKSACEKSSENEEKEASSEI